MVRFTWSFSTVAPSLGFASVCWAVVAGWLLSDLLGFWMYARIVATKPPARLAPGR